MKKPLYIAWGVLFALCAGLGFIPEPEGAVRGFLTFLSVGCFVPPALLVGFGWRNKDRSTLYLVRNLAMGSLALTLAALVGNFLILRAPEWLGNVLYAVLVMVSSPMVCSQYWILSLILWAGLLWTCILLLGKKEGR